MGGWVGVCMYGWMDGCRYVCRQAERERRWEEGRSVLREMHGHGALDELECVSAKRRQIRRLARSTAED